MYILVYKNALDITKVREFQTMEQLNNFVNYYQPNLTVIEIGSR